jgi:photosystem II stability/assembly factor-like uncharacterized protein
MDERELHELLSNAADGVVAPDDLAARAEHRYRRRRSRTQALVAAVVIVLIGSSVAGASVLARNNNSRATMSPSVTTAAPTIPGPTTIPALATGTIDPSQINALSFVDANVGFGLLADNGAATSLVVRTDDGGRNWRRVGELIEPEGGLQFENASEGVAWGGGPLEVTTDGGAHWTASDPVDNYLAWSAGRMWALTPCVQSTPCGSRPVLISDDSGVTWRRTALLQQGLGEATVLATSRSTAYVVEPATDAQQGPWQVATTGDGGASWTYKPVPCPTGTRSVSLAFNDRVLLLACVDTLAGDTTTKQEFTSNDNGTTWSRSSYIPGENADLSSVGTTFISNSGRTGLLSSTDDGKSWQATLPASDAVSTTVLPGVGMWVSIPNSGLWFSRDGLHWELRARSPQAVPPTSATVATPNTG